MSESEKIVRDAFEKAGKAFDDQKDLEDGVDDFYLFVTTKYGNKNLVQSFCSLAFGFWLTECFKLPIN